MTTYKTGNPLGSISPKDLFDNSENLDRAVNGAALSWKDRFDKSRLSWAGIEERARIDTEAAAAIATAQASEYKDEARQARDDAIAAAAASGDFVFAETYADALNKLPLPDGAIVEVGRDETHEGARVRYIVDSGLLKFAVNLDLLRIALADSSDPENGAGLVGFLQSGSGAIGMPLIKKARQYLHSEDYSFIPDGSDVTENALKLIHEAKVRRRPIEIGAGDFRISGSLGIAGLDFIGTRGGWKNEGGTRIFGDGSHHIFEQKAPMGNELNFSLRNIYVSGGLSAIYSRYGIFANVEDFFAEDVKQGVYLGTSSSYGPLWCNMRRVRIDATDEALLMDGNTVANANLFDTCFFKGGAQVDNVNDFIPAVRLRASGGYGALGNSFINTEVAGPGVGFSITSGAGFTFLGCYHEARGPQYHFSGAPRSVKIVSGIFAGSRNTHASPPCFIWHQRDNVNLSLDGGQIILGANDADQAGMSFFASQASGSINLDLISNPAITGSAAGFGLFGPGLPSHRVNALGYRSTYSASLMSTNGNSPSVGSGSIAATYRISGGICLVTAEINLGAGFVAQGQRWYLTTPPNLQASARSGGSGLIQRGSTSRPVAVYAYLGGLSLFDAMTGEPLGGDKPWTWQEGDRIFISASYPLA